MTAQIFVLHRKNVDRGDANVYLLIADRPDSNDREITESFLKNAPTPNAHVLKNKSPQGVGGNQKIVFRYAVENGFQSVAVLQGCNVALLNQLPEMFRTFDSEDNDALLAVNEYRSVVDKIAGGIHNKLTGAGLKGWRSAVRIYNTAALSNIAYVLNTNSENFDTEVLLQFVHAQRPIKEVALPRNTFGGGSCGGSLKDALKSSLKFFFQRFHLFYDVRFHASILSDAHLTREQHEAPVYESKMSSVSPHSLVCESENIVPKESRVLDIGCSKGYVATYLSKRKGCRVVGIDVLPRSEVSPDGFRYEQINLETELGKLNDVLIRDEFDTILMLDVLEHLAVPESFLLNLSQHKFPTSPRFVCSTANVAFIVIRIMLLLGHFNYGRRGILDITHKRLFSAHTFRNILTQTGFVITHEHYIPFPFASLGWPASVAKKLETINRWLIKLRPRLFSYQILFEATPLSAPDLVLK